MSIPCKICGKFFTPDHPARKICSVKCKKEANRRSMKVYMRGYRERKRTQGA